MTVKLTGTNLTGGKFVPLQFTIPRAAGGSYAHITYSSDFLVAMGDKDLPRPRRTGAENENHQDIQLSSFVTTTCFRICLAFVSQCFPAAILMSSTLPPNLAAKPLPLLLYKDPGPRN